MNLKRVFDAESVAVIGASRDDKKRGFQAVRALIEGKYMGEIYPINPKEEHILGLKCYPNLEAVGERIDLALITTPAKTILDIICQCGEASVAGAVIIAGGFGELGAEGMALQNEIACVAKRYGVRLIGPNTSGMVNVHSNMNLVGLSDIPKGTSPSSPRAETWRCT